MKRWGIRTRNRSLPKSQLPVMEWTRPIGMFQPAVLPKPVWQDLLPLRLSQVTPEPFFTTATAKYVA